MAAVKKVEEGGAATTAAATAGAGPEAEVEAEEHLLAATPARCWAVVRGLCGWAKKGPDCRDQPKAAA